MTKKKKAGRPKKQIEDTLPNNWQEIAINLYKKGASDVEVRCALELFNDQIWYRWIEEDEEFSRTIKKGKLLSQAWWEEIGRTNLQSKDLNHGLWYMNMKNRFGWRDRQPGEGIDAEDFIGFFKEISSAISQLDTNSG